MGPGAGLSILEKRKFSGSAGIWNTYHPAPSPVTMLTELFHVLYNNTELYRVLHIPCNCIWIDISYDIHKIDEGIWQYNSWKPHFLVICVVLFVICVVLCTVLCVNVYGTTATRFKPNCIRQIYRTTWISLIMFRLEAKHVEGCMT